MQVAKPATGPLGDGPQECPAGSGSSRSLPPLRPRPPGARPRSREVSRAGSGRDRRSPGRSGRSWAGPPGRLEKDVAARGRVVALQAQPVVARCRQQPAQGPEKGLLPARPEPERPDIPRPRSPRPDTTGRAGTPRSGRAGRTTGGPRRPARFRPRPRPGPAFARPRKPPTRP
jgi:hypothetical protein